MNTTVIFTNNSLTARHIISITKTTGLELMGVSKALLIEEAKCLEILLILGVK